MTLKEIREAKGLNPSYVANKLNMKYRQFYNLETGKTKMTLDRALKLSKLYSVSMKAIEEGANKGIEG